MILMPKFDTVIFVHGCFWHRHEGCPKAYSPKSRVEFWENKFRDNVERDKRDRKKLENLGWKVFTVWECETDNIEKLTEKVTTFLQI